MDAINVNCRSIQVCFQLHPLAVNMALSSFVAEYCAAACVTIAWLPVTVLCQSYSSAAPAGQIDGQTPYRYIDPALHTMQALPITK